MTMYDIERGGGTLAPATLIFSHRGGITEEPTLATNKQLTRGRKLLTFGSIALET
jgi:hypothetical protein